MGGRRLPKPGTTLHVWVVHRLEVLHVEGEMSFIQPGRLSVRELHGASFRLGGQAFTSPGPAHLHLAHRLRLSLRSHWRAMRAAQREAHRRKQQVASLIARIKTLEAQYGTIVESDAVADT